METRAPLRASKDAGKALDWLNPIMSKKAPPKGRGVASNPLNRFEHITVEPDPELDPAENPRPETLFLRDGSQSVISYNSSPDVGFDASLNPYRGCEHGCPYCYARPTHEYLGFSAGLEFETRIMVKEDAPDLLRRELSAPRWEPQSLALSGVTDPYQPVERRLEITRRCLEVLVELRNPVMVVTKNHLVTRDVDYLAQLAAYGAATVAITMTTLDTSLARHLEPRASSPKRRLDAISRLAQAGIPVSVLMAPIVPAINDHEIPAVIAAAAAAGATSAGYVVLRLPGAVEGLMNDWLEHHFPERREKVLGRLRDLRGGRLQEGRFGHRMRGSGPYAEQIRGLYRLACQRAGLDRHRPELVTTEFRRPGGSQLSLFET
jgi:DNA repair photolyase